MGKKRGISPILYKSLGRKSTLDSRQQSRGQVSTFLIISLVLVLLVSVVFYVINSQLSLREKVSQSVISELSLFPPQKFVTHCVQKEVADISKMVLSQGGVYDLTAAQNQSISNGRSLDSFSFRAQPYLFWSRTSGDQFISNEFVANQINSELPGALLSCLNLSLYADQGYTVRAGKLLTNTTIVQDTVNVLVYYPLTIEKGGSSVDSSVYSVSVDLPIGSLLSTARELVNSHILEQPQDTQSLMHQDTNNWLNKPLIVIDKNTVYPHTLYSLQMSYKELSVALRFAIEGVDVFSSSNSFSAAGTNSQLNSQLLSATKGLFTAALSPSALVLQTSSCVAKDGSCFSAVPYTTCVNNGGQFVQDNSCTIHRAPISDNIVQKFKSCTFADGSSIPSGSSWCSAGSDGQPLIGVGSRHSRLLCVDGNILQEPCQDYRLEVCAQLPKANANDLLVAQCQQNKATSCSVCTDKTCCTDAIHASSCAYTAQQVCVPRVPIGIPFWQAGITTCQEQFATSLFSANGKITSPTAQTMLCAQQADCGATMSFIGETTQTVTDSQYYSRLTSFWQQQSIPYSSLTLRDNAALQTSSQLSATSQTQLSHVVSQSRQPTSVSSMLSGALGDIEQLASYNATDYLNPNVTITLTTQTLTCQSYLAPQSPSCSFCSVFEKACSEYVCRSLGATCRAIQNVSSQSGVTCIDASSLVTQPLHVIKVTDGRATPLADATIGSLSGYKVQQPLSAHDLLTINLTTDRPARCKPTYLPFQSYADVSSLDMSSGVFSTQHQLRIRFVNDLPVFDRMLINFAVPNYKQLVDALADFKLRLDQLRLKYGFIQKYNPTFYPYLNTIVEQYLSSKTRPTLLALIDDISQKQFAIFFVCQDEYGNELRTIPQTTRQSSQSTTVTTAGTTTATAATTTVTTSITPAVNTPATATTNTAQIDPAQNPFVQFTLQSSCTPQPPQIFSVVADAAPYVQKTMSFYLNKLGSCRFDSESYTYDSMRYNMSCASSEYDLSSANDGSYACVADVSLLPRDATLMYVACSDKISGGLTAMNIPIVIDATAPARVGVNLSNSSLSEIVLSSKATIWTGAGYRCDVMQNMSSASSSSISPKLSLVCTSDACSISTTTVAAGSSATAFVDAALVCTPRVASSSCPQDQTHSSAPQAFPVVRLPSFVYDEARVYGQEFVVTVTSRGTPITCSLTDAGGKTYSLIEKTNQTFTMPSASLVENSLVTITCSDGYGLAPQFVSVIRKSQ